MRAMGAIFLALAAILLVSLTATRLLRAGLTVLAIVVGVVTAARVLGAVVDGAAFETLFKLVPEVVLLALSLAGLAIEAVRRRPPLPAAAAPWSERACRNGKFRGTPPSSACVDASPSQV
jgi:hypothetical protein